MRALCSKCKKTFEASNRAKVRRKCVHCGHKWEVRKKTAFTCDSTDLGVETAIRLATLIEVCGTFGVRTEVKSGREYHYPYISLETSRPGVAVLEDLADKLKVALVRFNRSKTDLGTSQRARIRISGWKPVGRVVQMIAPHLTKRGVQRMEEMLDRFNGEHADDQAD